MKTVLSRCYILTLQKEAANEAADIEEEEEEEEEEEVPEPEEEEWQSEEEVAVGSIWLFLYRSLDDEAEDLKLAKVKMMKITEEAREERSCL